MKTIFSILGLIAAVGTFLMYTQPAYDEVQALRKQIEHYDQALDKADELQRLKATLLERRKGFDPEDLDRLHKLLPDHVDNVRLILDIDRLAGNYGMALQNVVVSDPASETAGGTVIGGTGEGDRHDSLTLRFSTRGTYQDFVAFLEGLESSLRIVDLVSLAVAPDSPTGIVAEDSYRYDITIRTYWLR